MLPPEQLAVRDGGTAAAAARAQPPRRVGWLDAARGLGIILVVIGHGLGGLIDSDSYGREAGLRDAFFSIYVFHMPLFFMLSGALVAQRLERDSQRFVTSLGMSIVWPYFLWSVIQYTVIYALAGAVNQPAHSYWPILLQLPVRTVSQYWFLYALFVMHVASWLLLRRLGTMTFFLVMLCLKPMTLVVPMPDLVRLIAHQAPFYALGVMLQAPGIANVIVRRPYWARLTLAPALAAACITLCLVATEADAGARFAGGSSGIVAGLAAHVRNFPAALAGAFAVIGVAASFSGRAAAVIAFLGRRSMAIFVLHVMAVAGTRIVLNKLLHIASPWPVLVVAVIMGIVLPLIAYEAASRARLTRILGLG